MHFLHWRKCEQRTSLHMHGIFLFFFFYFLFYFFFFFLSLLGKIHPPTLANCQVLHPEGRVYWLSDVRSIPYGFFLREDRLILHHPAYIPGWLRDHSIDTAASIPMVDCGIACSMMPRVLTSFPYPDSILQICTYPFEHFRNITIRDPESGRPNRSYWTHCITLQPQPFALPQFLPGRGGRK